MITHIPQLWRYILLPQAQLSRITPGRITASVDPRVLSRNAPETLASGSILLSRLHCGGEVTATGKIGSRNPRFLEVHQASKGIVLCRDEKVYSNSPFFLCRVRAFYLSSSFRADAPLGLVFPQNRGSRHTLGTSSSSGSVSSLRLREDG
jgi:hypothetical protein